MEFLQHEGLLSFSRSCFRGHAWKLGSGGARCTVVTGHETPDPEDEHKDTRIHCGAKKTWCLGEGIGKLVPKNLAAGTLVKIIYLYVNETSAKQIRRETV